MAAFRARRFVWYAISSMIDTFSAMFLMASTVSLTVRPLSSASLAPFTASCSVWRLFSAFWVMEADICSRLEVVSSTEAACSLVPWERVCEVAETWAEAEDSPVAPWRISVMVWLRRPTMSDERVAEGVFV